MGDEFDIDVTDLTTNEPAAAEAELVEKPPPERPPAEAVSARKPGPLGWLPRKVNQFFSRITLPQWDLRTFLYLLVALILLVLLARNWTPVRIDLFGWRFDAPKPMVFLISFLLGVGLHWRWRHTEHRVAGEQAEEQPSPDSES